MIKHTSNANRYMIQVDNHQVSPALKDVTVSDIACFVNAIGMTNIFSTFINK